MKLRQVPWQPLMLSLLSLGTLVALAWSLLWHTSDAAPYMPHEHCYLWNPGLIALHGWSDLLIGCSYVAISATLTYLVLRARREIPFHWMMLAFATFIVACGGTHFVEVWTLKATNPHYWLAGNVKLITAFASVATAFLLPPLVPRIRHLLEEARLSADRQIALALAHQQLEDAHAHVQALDHLKTNFFANISHELRTPVTLITGPVDHLLADPTLPQLARSELQMVRRNAMLLHKHVNDLLEVSRIEAGKLQMQYAQADLAQIVRLVGSYFSSTGARAMELSISAPASLPIEADPDKLERVFLNLLSNAFKFTPEHGLVRVSVGSEDGEAVVAVEDSGPGVPPDMRDAIFERFHQGVNPTSRGGAGTGLGLSIVKEFVSLHGGSVTVSDREGGGASFQVRLPLRAPVGTAVLPARETVTRSAAAEVHLGATRGAVEPEANPSAVEQNLPYIVLAEDNLDMSDHICRTLAPAYRIRRARNGAEALRLAREEVPDLILTDLTMPEMGGDELLQHVRRDAALSTIPVILLTARADDEVRLKLLQQGAQDYLIKPFGADELRARVGNQIATKRVRDTLQTELASQEQDVARLALEVTLRARELERAKDAAESANRAKDQFLAILSHELRTPLTPVLAAAINLESQSLVSHDELRDSLKLIRRNVELEARLIDDLLDLTRIARGKLHLELGDVDAHQAIRHAVEMCQSEITNKGSRVQLELAARNFRVQADAPRLLQIVWNLVLNAVKFTPADGRITIRTSNRGENRLTITVSDTGIGIMPEVLARIFDPFEQGEQSLTRRFGGLGLGLAVAKGLVDAHGGTIVAVSDGPGCGAAFTIELACLPARETPSTQLDFSLAAGPAAKGVRILLVEDHDDTRHAMSRLLRRWGHDVDTAGGVQEGLAKAEAGNFELVVSDLGLPDGKGTELMIELKRRFPNLRGIAISGFGMEEDIQRSHEAGFFEHLTKPVGAQRLQAVVEQVATQLRNGS